MKEVHQKLKSAECEPGLGINKLKTKNMIEIFPHEEEKDVNDLISGLAAA